MKLGVHIPVWGRLPLVRVVLRHLVAVREQLAQPAHSDEARHELVIAVAGSPEDTPELPMLCGEFGIEYVHVPNQPLGAKVNAAVLHLMRMGCDAAIGIGSDDLVGIGVFRALGDELDNGTDYIGMTDLYCLDLEANRLVYWPGYTNHRVGETIGLGRCLSASLLDVLLWRPFEPDCKVNLDWSLTQKLRWRQYSSAALSLRHIGAMMVDVKSSLGNINPMPDYGDPCPDPHGMLVKHFGEDIVAELYGVRS